MAPAILTVKSGLDDGGGPTLRSVIAGAAAGDTITFDPTLANKTIQLDATRGAIPILQNQTIDGRNQVDPNHPSLNVTINGNNGTTTSAIFSVSNSANVEVDYLGLNNGSASGRGGAIGVADSQVGGTLTLNNDTFNSDSAASGGAVGWWGGALTANNCNFRSCTALNAGGAIFTKTDATLNTDAFTSDTAQEYGGAVAALYDGATMHSVTVNNSAFVSNQVTGTTSENWDTYQGGAIYSNFPLTVTGGTFSGNTARDDGGAIAFIPAQNKNANLSLTNITFNLANKASRGGAVYSDVNNSQNTVSVTMTGCLVSGNVADGPSAQAKFLEGGGLYVTHITTGTASASVGIADSTFYNNTAS